MNNYCSNKMYTQRYIIGYVISLLIGLASCDHCTQQDIELCWKPMWDIPEHLTWTSIVPTLPEAEMKQHCEIFDEVEVCLNGLKSHCDILDIKSHEGVIGAYEYLCDDTFDEYLLHRECFINTDLHNEGRHCNETLVRKLDSIDHSKSTDYQFQRICQYANDYLDCVENAVSAFCGTDAATWQRILDVKNIQPILQLANCQLDGNIVTYSIEDKTRTYIIIACIAVISVVMILMALSMFLIYRSRKHQPYINRQVNYTNGGAATVNTVGSTGGSAQAGPLPQKFPEPPPYDGNAPPPVYTTPSEYSAPVNSDYVNMGGAAAPASVLSNPPSYKEKTSAPSSEYSSDRQGVDNPVYHDFSKDD